MSLTIDDDVLSDARKLLETDKRSLSQFAVDAMELLLSREAPSKPTKNISQFPSQAHLQAAAGSPLGAEVMDWSGSNDTVLVKICGLSMEPDLHDGDVIAMKHKRASRNPFMKKGLIYLVQYDGGYTVKRYNTRKPSSATHAA